MGNTIQAINAREVWIIRCGTGIVEWRKNEPEAIGRTTRKILTIYRRLHQREDVDRLYWTSKTSKKGLISAEECVSMRKTSLGFYMKEQE